MPKVSAAQYCSHLRQLITSIGDFYGCGKKVPESVPESLSKYEIVVEQYVAIYLTLFGKQYLHRILCDSFQRFTFLQIDGE